MGSENIIYKSALPNESEPENPEKSIEKQDNSELMERVAHVHRLEQSLKYGFLDKDSKTYVFAKNILDNLVKSTNTETRFNLQIVKSNSKEAYITKAGNEIYITTGLIADLEFEETLAGVLAHEMVHVLQNHFDEGKIEKGGDLPDAFKRVARRQGKRRLNEYEADLRASLQILEEAGYSPLGLQIFFEKIAQNEFYGDVHGRSTDRALNIAAGTYMIDLRSLSSDLQPMPEEIITETTNARRNDASAMFSDPFSHSKLIKTPEERNDQRRGAEEELDDVEKILIAIKNSGKLSQVEENIEYQKRLTDKFKRKIADAAGISEDDPKIYFYVYTLSGLNAPEFENYIESITIDDFIYLAENMESLSISKFSVLNSVEDFSKIILRSLTKSEGRTISLNDSKRIYNSILELLSKVSLQSRDHIESQLVQIFSNEFEEHKDSFEVKVSREEKVYQKILNDKEKTELPDIFLDTTFSKQPLFVDSFFKRFLKGKNIDESFKIIDQLHLQLNDELLDIQQGSKVTRGEKIQNTDDKKSSAIVLNIFYTISELIRKVVKDSNNLSNFEKNILINHLGNVSNGYGADGIEGIKLALYTLNPDNIHLDEDEYEDASDYTEDILSRKIKAQIELFFYPPKYFKLDDVSTDDMIEAYKFISSFDGRLINASNPFTKLEKSTVVMDHLFDNFILNNGISEVIDLKHKFEQLDVDLRSLISPEKERLHTAIIESILNGDIDDLSLEDKLFLTFFIPNPFLKQEASSYFLNQDLESLSYEEKKSLLFKGEKDFIHNLEIREKFFEDEITNADRFSDIKKTIENSLRVSPEEDKLMLVFTDRLSFLRLNESAKLLGILLGTGEKKNNEELREYISDFFDGLSIKLSPDQVEIFSSTLLRGNMLLRSGLVRKILTQENGLLRSEEGRKKFFDLILEKSITKNGDTSLSDILEDISDSLVEEDDWQRIYFAFQGILSEKILVPPIKTERDKTNFKSESPDTISRMQSEDRLFLFLKSKGYINERKHKVSELEFIKEAAGNMGALGRRFLQVLPQVVDVGEEYTREFSDIYDRVKGQSKLSALLTLEREWPEMWDEIDSIDEMVGGGSIVSVFSAKTKEGKSEVIKVRNPNIEFHLEEVQKIAKSIMSRLVKKHGGAYAQAESVVDDVVQWIKNDIDFDSFLEKDAAFRDMYQGYSSDNNQYKIRIPESVGPTNRYFSREEKIMGTNLTSMDTMMEDPSYDMKQVVSLLVNFYVQQIMDGRLHSDVHPGNFSVTENKEVVMYDRNYYLDLTEKEKSAIVSIFIPFIPVEEKVLALSDLLNVPPEGSEEIEGFVEDLSTGNVEDAKKRIIALKILGAKIPLNITLLLKNISVLQGLSKQVGFNNIFDALEGE